MIPTIPLALLAGLLTGLVFAWAARGPFHDGRNPWGDEVRAVASYELLIRWPLVIYFFLVHREWSFLYLVEADRLPGWLLLVLLPLDAAALLGGYFGGWSLLRRRARSLLQLVIGGVGLALVLFVIALRERLLKEGDTHGWSVEVHPPSIDGHLLAVVLVALGGSVAAAVFVYRTLSSSGSRRKSGGTRAP